MFVLNTLITTYITLSETRFIKYHVKVDGQYEMKNIYTYFPYFMFSNQLTSPVEK